MSTSLDLEGGRAIPALEVRSAEHPKVVIVSKLDGSYDGETLEQKLDDLIKTSSVVVISRTWCPFCKDAITFLTEQIGVKTHVLQVNEMERGDAILVYLQRKTGHKTVPLVYIKGEMKGGCDDIKALHKSGDLEKLTHDLVQHERVVGTERLETTKLVESNRGSAVNPPFWFPNTVNNRVVRMTGVQVFILSALSCAFHTELWSHYVAVFLVIDFMIRMTVGSFLSPLGMIATFLTSPFEPVFKPGPPKQFAAFCGLFFSTMGTLFYFVDFKHHRAVGAIWMGMLAGAAGMEGFLNFCLGCVFYSFGIQVGLIPDHVYRIYTSTRQETIESWHYMFDDSNSTPPLKVDTNPKSSISLKYKIKSDEWTKDDFQPVRNMQVSYFAMPLSLAGLAVAFKIGTEWSTRSVLSDDRTILVPDIWHRVIATVAAVFFIVFLSQYMVRLIRYPKKCWKEWDHPLYSTGFGIITITVMLFAFLIYDQISFDNDSNEEVPHAVARVLFWAGAISHVLLTVSKTGEWIGRRLEMEHVYPHWMIFPVGLAVAALVAGVVQPFDPFDNSNSKGNILIARFFNSFAMLMWITLFVITFFKVATTHNSDNRVRHGVWIWLAAPCVLGLSHYSICAAESRVEIDGELTFGRSYLSECESTFAEYYFVGIFFLLSLCWATLPHLAFFGRDPFGMGYWIECFSLDTLAACGCFFYSLNGYRISQALQWIGLVGAFICNFCAFLHTMVGIVRRRGVFTPEVKWGPLSFMKLTHEAFRGFLPTLEYYLKAMDLDDTSVAGKANIDLFAAHFNQFRILHEEHSKHEDDVIFKAFDDLFPNHAKQYNDDHEEGHVQFDNWCRLINKVLDTSLLLEERKVALEQIKDKLPQFIDDFEEHLQGEEDNLNPIGRKYIPLELMKQISREVWNLTAADRWEIIVPFIVNNLPRHMQRVRYLKVLTWSMPERAQQIGAIVYRGTDAVTWERLRAELPEIIPRGAPGWKHYY